MCEDELITLLKELRYAYEALTVGDLSRLCRNKRKTERLKKLLEATTKLIWEARGELPGGV